MQEAIPNVEEAMKQLVEKNSDRTNNEENGTGDIQENNDGHNNGTKAPKTSDDFPMFLWLAGILGAIELLRARKK